MRNQFYSIAMLMLFLLVPASIIWAQTSTTQNGMTSISFFFKEGNILVYLPDDIRPGDVISGSVEMNPSGKNNSTRGKAMNQLLEKKLRLGNALDPQQVGKALLQKYPGNSGLRRFQTTVSLPFVIAATDDNGKELQQPVLLRGPDVFFSNNGCSSPTHVLNAAPLRITGSFDGDASNTKCNVGGQDAYVLAESPRQCLLRTPSLPVGVQSVSVTENGKLTCETKVRNIDLSVTAGKMNLARSETSYILVEVTGLDHLRDTALLTIQNQSTEIIAMAPLNNQVIILSPDSFQTQSNYSKRLVVTGIQPGSFSVKVNLDLPGIQFDIPSANTLKQNPGSYGWRGGDPCETKGPITWRWHRTLPCAVELKVNPYGTSPADKEVIDFIIDQFKELSKKGGKLGEKMAKCFSFSGRAFSMYGRCYRDWDDWDVTYECVNGVWVQTSTTYVGSGRDNLSGWIELRNAGGNNEWFATDSFDWIIDAIAKSVFCCD